MATLQPARLALLRPIGQLGAEHSLSAAASDERSRWECVWDVRELAIGQQSIIEAVHH